MTEFKKNKIWGCITTNEAIERLSEYKFFFANANHCLVISDEQPEGTVEMTDEFIKRFKEDDWMWITSIIDLVRKEQIDNNPNLAKEMEKQNEEFLARFRKGLVEWRETNGRGTVENK